MRKWMLSLGIGFAAAAMAAPALAQSGRPVQLEGYVKLEKVVVDESGERRTELVDPVTVVPGDRLVMGTRYANEGDTLIENFVVSNPVPAPVRVAEIADPAQIVSVDGGRSWGPFADRVVRAPDGSQRPALPGDITHFRWTIAAVAPGGSGAVEFVVTVR